MPAFPNALQAIQSTPDPGPVPTPTMMLCSTLNFKSGRRISSISMRVSETSRFREVQIPTALMMTLGCHMQTMARFWYTSMVSTTTSRCWIYRQRQHLLSNLSEAPSTSTWRSSLSQHGYTRFQTPQTPSRISFVDSYRIIHTRMIRN